MAIQGYWAMDHNDTETALRCLTHPAVSLDWVDDIMKSLNEKLLDFLKCKSVEVNPLLMLEQLSRTSIHDAFFYQREHCLDMTLFECLLKFAEESNHLTGTY
jgi:hypothetical protein